MSEIRTDPEWTWSHDERAGYLTLRDGKVARTIDLHGDFVMADLDADGNLLGIEVLL